MKNQQNSIDVLTSGVYSKGFNKEWNFITTARWCETDDITVGDVFSSFYRYSQSISKLCDI